MLDFNLPLVKGETNFCVNRICSHKQNINGNFDGMGKNAVFGPFLVKFRVERNPFETRF